jgi:uncharacterized protein GlcG (DUF336 family)
MELPKARVALDAALAHADTLGVRVSCCVVDGAGHEVLTARMPGAFWFTPGVARAKARTAVAMGMDSGDVAALATTYPALMPVIDEQLPFTLTTLGGGLVVRDGDAVRGAIAVSGASPGQDVECARVAVAAAAAH